MTEPDLVTCASCGGLPEFKRARCFFCADGSDPRPGVHSQAMHVECVLLSKSISFAHILRMRKNHGLVHDAVDKELVDRMALDE